jgi:CRISPR/Cas system-associated endonuclease Cas1
MLNYAYAILQNRIQINSIAEGYDPTIGIMHNGRRGEPALAFDLMESYRPRVDAAVLSCARREIKLGGFHAPIGWRGEGRAAAGETGVPVDK